MEVTLEQIYGFNCTFFFFLLVFSLSCPGFTGGNHMALHKHLSLEERFFIAKKLDSNAPFKSIALELDRDCTTISKEIRAHKIFRKTGAHGRAFNNCTLRVRCDRRRLCSPCNSRRYCWSCKKCTSVCPDFVEEKCSRLSRPPYVCNGCPDLKKCTLEKCFYQAVYADEEYHTTLRESREGIALSEAEVQRLDSILSPLIKKGQSLNHILANNRDSITVSRSTIYRLINYNIFNARNIDLPRKVRYSKRKVRVHAKVDKKCRIGRTYEDFLLFMQEHPHLPVTQLDSVEGKKGGKVLLTIHLVKAEFMLAFLREANNSQSVIDIFEKLYLELRPDRFSKLMPVLLADNGTEFSNPSAIELDRQQNLRTHLFYCDPSAPYQKGSAERNHEFIRCFLPKGSSLDSYTQGDISIMMDHINSYCRESLGNKTPYEMMAFLYGKDLLDLLGCHRIAPNEVTMNPSVFPDKGGTKE